MIIKKLDGAGAGGFGLLYISVVLKFCSGLTTHVKLKSYKKDVQLLLFLFLFLFLYEIINKLTSK
jgi:hypothetical protein